MAGTQGEFATREAAEAAKAALTAAGVPAAKIHIWNTFPESAPTGGGTGGTFTGAVTGGVLAGGRGLVTGAVLGTLLDTGGDSHIPPPSGARVVVDADAGGADAAALLRQSGASNVRGV